MPSVCAALALAVLAFHPESLSSSRVVVGGTDAHAIVRCQILSLTEVLPNLDANNDGHVGDDEIALSRAEIIDYVSAHYHLRTGTDRSHGGGVLLTPCEASVIRVIDSSDLMLHRDGAVDVTMDFRHVEPILDLVVEMTLFAQTSPDHVDLTTIDWGEAGVDTFGLDAHGHRERSDPTGRGAFVAFLGLGIRHILNGWDHLAFLAVLILASRRLRSLLAVITGFTIAHSVTLVLSSAGVISVSRFAGTIEVAIALSIVYVAIDTLLAPGLRRSRWVEALAFGLLHGLGFATFLGQSLVHEPERVVPLAAFNLGVEAGQILVVGVIVGVLRFLPRRHDDRDSIAPAWLRMGGAIAIALVGIWWVVERL